MIGLGSNLGRPLAQLRSALGRLAELGQVVAISPLYHSAPVGGPPQPDYLNAAARLRSEMSPPALLAGLSSIERAAGRERRVRWGPRTLDLDILWIEGLALQTGELSVPHPRLRERAFALRPLLDVASEAVDPRDGMSYAALAVGLDGSGLWRLTGDWVERDPIDLPPGMDSPGS